ncbi:F-box domain protein [Paecilomyces variotii No. 5]|uniref:F-box domain protein n=1 Tax=Byssochlamys spectabilis (strain No. 5 / NBRC 109023) TaxID=1356009 RepID=V5FUR9_BYSSN|nr:F-box domain protein [Paecilomyces variotii No. 5]
MDSEHGENEPGYSPSHVQDPEGSTIAEIQTAQQETDSTATGILGSNNVQTPEPKNKQDPAHESKLLSLPPEIIDQILYYVSARDLACASTTCRTLANHGYNELLWADIVNANLPSKIDTPGPFPSFRSLYVAHHPYWFLPRNKIWFSDSAATGNLILTRYDNRRGVIEGYRVVAEKRSVQFRTWDYDSEVIIQSFTPRVRLWLDDPVILLKNTTCAPLSRRQYLHGEIRMPMPLESQHVYNSLSLCTGEIPPDEKASPDKQWPPLTIPSRNRVYRNGAVHWSEWDNRPQNIRQVSEFAFRVRRWAHFRMGLPIFAAGSSETMSTYATLEPELYIPTREKPYQGIWVGDYSDHGCEFLLFLQRGKGSVSSSSSIEQAGGEGHTHAAENEVAEEGEIQGDGLIQKGSLEAIKLTGDPNVPRGEISWISEDIGPGGLVRIAEEDPFRGARMVRSRGHVAHLGFRDDKFLSSQLILISRDCIAHYWEDLDHISYFYRVDIDELLRT